MKWTAVLLAGMIIALACLLFVLPTPVPVSNTPVSVIADASDKPAAPTAFHYEVVTDPAAQERGLGGRTDVPADYGMLFVFPQDDTVGFWMKDMLVPIDIIWLSDTGTILGIDADVATSTYPNVFYPPEPVKYVLETRAGNAAAQGWTVGTALPIPLQK